MRRPLRALCVLSAAPLAAAALAVPSPAAVPLGTQSDELSGSSAPAVPTGSVLATLQDSRPGHHVAAPEDGVITSWRSYEFSGTATASLVVLQRTAGSDEMRIVWSSLPVTATTSWFGGKTQLPIRAGQQVGVQVNGTYGFSHFFWGQNVPDPDEPGDPSTGSYAIYEGLVPGGPPAAPRPGETGITTGAVFQVQAMVEPDADDDGFGDETQDLCPDVASDDQTDTDRDGVGDVCDPDIDGDGLSNADEAGHGTDPLDADSDGDGLRDDEEVTRGTDPLKTDSDDDGVDDARELAVGLDPLRADTDGDGFRDGDDRCALIAGTDGGCPTEPESPPTVTTTVTTTVEREPTTPAPAPAPAPDQAPRREAVGRARPGAVSSRSTVGRRGATTAVTTTGTVRRPAGVDAASACRGSVSVQVKRGRVTLSMRRVGLDRACRFRSAVRFGARVRSGDRLRVHVTFGGNRAVEGRRATTRTVVVR